MSGAERNRPPSFPSTSSLHHNNPSRASRRPPPPLAKVVTVPPWARDEPPSPTEDVLASVSHHDHQFQPPQTSDSVSFQTDPEGASRWWTFTLPRMREQYSDLRSNSPSSQRPVRPERKGFREKSISWLQASTSLKETVSTPSVRREKDAEKGDQYPSPTSNLPLPSTAAHASTPGWDMPWSARLAAQGPHPQYSHESDSDGDDRSTVRDGLTGWAARRKRIRSFILTNNYVPLLFRFINISFTTAALGMAIHIRQLELKTHTMGAVGSSPTVVIIFAPLTLVHVMMAIYLEYFGRPLGLWRTSAKLAHTLSEVLFICAWSASLSLCFDNFFTSLVPCAAPSSTSWYNELHRPDFNLPYLEGPAGRRICDSQLALICLVGVGLVAYCTNLVISLYRIFEKVKYHPPVLHPTLRSS
ncbi:hypothetical protein D9611_003280 [Ephemerocybe angulata]|uniref:Uncharacterized protein n=1 Tax=Ephemerocybe angulata TaxID=980116 RepID=A0A8H5C905_9AGAR|nr:hypothetical protein D9611_003280 [Tulosesus angulatus]